MLLLITQITSAEVSKGVGISSWVAWRPDKVSRMESPELKSVPLIMHWRDLESYPGEYAFDQKIGEPLRVVAAQDLYASVMIWVGPSSPSWIYDVGVPAVYTDRERNALGRVVSQEQNRFPYYFHPEYKKRFFDLIDAFGKYVADLPAELRERIILVQSAEGSTGDGSPYKGNPLEGQFYISDGDWNTFRLNEAAVRQLFKVWFVLRWSFLAECPDD
jgi:hypothetical protein